MGLAGARLIPPNAFTRAGIVNVKDYGAVGDGVHDDTAAIQAAINAAAGKGPCLIGQAGDTFNISSEISVPSSSHLIVNGTMYLMDNSNCSIFLIPQNTSDVTIEGTGTLNGNKANNGTFGTNGNGGIVTPFLSNGTGQNVSKVRVSGLTIKNCFSWGVNLAGVSDGWITECVFTDNGNANQFSAGATRCHFSRCVASGTNDDGFALYSGVTYSTIEGCTSYSNSGGSGIEVRNDANQTLACHDITIVGNICYLNDGGGIDVTSAQTPVVNNYNVTIVGNVCYANDQINGFEAGIVIGGGATNCLVSGNICHHNGNGSNGAAGILLSSSGQHHVVKGNQCFDNGIGSTSGGYGIWADPGITDCTIEGNQFWDDQATKTQAYGISGFGGANIVIRGNWLGSSVGTPGIGNLHSPLGSGTVLEGNYGSNAYNPVGLTTETLPASGTAYTNTSGVRQRIFLTGGTMTALSINGTATGIVSTPANFELDPGETFTATYSSAPTMKVFGL